jgi:putative FmdB family regulatory protein
MPIYEYRCCDCDKHFEVMQKFSDPPIETCTSCSGTVQKLISRSAFHLKGSGWYVTDYARNANSKTASKNGNAESGDTKSTGEGAEASKTASSESSKTTSSESSKTTSSESSKSAAPSSAA